MAIDINLTNLDVFLIVCLFIGLPLTIPTTIFGIAGWKLLSARPLIGVFLGLFVGIANIFFGGWVLFLLSPLLRKGNDFAILNQIILYIIIGVITSVPIVLAMRAWSRRQQRLHPNP